MRKQILVVPVALMISACGSDTLLASRSTPDEMAVVDGPTLSLPPNFELRPPVSEYEMQAQQRQNNEVKNLLLGATETQQDTTNTAEDSWLLQQVGADKRDPNIREKLRGDTTFEQKQAKRSWWEKQKDKMFGGDEHPINQTTTPEE